MSQVPFKAHADMGTGALMSGDINFSVLVKVTSGNAQINSCWMSQCIVNLGSAQIDPRRGNVSTL